MIKITAGGTVGVVLESGIVYPAKTGETVTGTPESEAFLIERGAAVKEEPEAETADIGKMTAAQLKAALIARGIKIPDGAKKAELVALMEGGNGV